MLAEVEHRTANDFAPAIATLQFARRSIPVGRRVEIDDAIARLGRQAALSRLFLTLLVDEAIDFGAALWKLCEALSAIRLDLTASPWRSTSIIQEFRSGRAG